MYACHPKPHGEAALTLSARLVAVAEVGKKTIAPKVLQEVARKMAWTLVAYHVQAVLEGAKLDVLRS